MTSNPKARETLHEELRRRLGQRTLSRGWAKSEIFLGLLAAGAALFVGLPGTAPPAWEWGAPCLVLFVLGSYLALAGHRSHLYQSANEQLALLVEEIRTLDRKDTHP